MKTYCFGFPLLQVCIGSLFVIASMSISSYTHAGELDRFSGWAWSDNIGWISFNCTNTSTCDTVDYGVTMTNTGGATESLSGWAWSDNIGWIDFSGATFTLSSGTLSGTAQVYNTSVLPFRSGDGEDDGWDGVIDLSDTSPVAYGPVWDATDNTSDGWNWDDGTYYLFDGYAWADEVVGWVKFSCQDSDGGGADTNTCGTVGYGVFLEPLYMDFTASQGLTFGDQVPYNGSFNHIWMVEPTSQVGSCTGSNGPGTWSDVPTKSFSPVPTSEGVSSNTDDATSRLECVHSPSGKTVSRDRFIYVAPPVPVMSFTADDTNIPFNTSTTLRWTLDHVDTCTLTGPASGVPAYSDTSVATGTNITITSGSLTDATNDFILKCTSPYPELAGNEYLANETVYVERLEFDFYAEDEDGNRMNNGDLVAYSNRDEISLVWDLEFATNGCTASNAHGDTTDWVGAKSSADGRNTEIAPMPDAGNFSFTLQCNGTNGQSAQGTVTIKLGNNPDFSEEITNDLQ